MSVSPQLIEQTERFKHWITKDALPLWSSKGINSSNGASYERFLADGSPDTTVNNRIRVQARQIFVFSYAQHHGLLDNAKNTVDGLVGFYETTGRHPSKPGFAHLLSSDYKLIDDKQDLYDHAFAFLAWAWRYRTYFDENCLAQADELLRYIDEKFGNASGGWFEGDYDTDVRRQNPHMHLFEAFMALYEASRQAKWLARAGEIFSLFETVFFDQEHGVLREFFGENWQIRPSGKGNIIEPGHMMEWVWLLRWYESLSGHNVDKYAHRLYTSALKYGMTESGLMLDEVSLSGKNLPLTKRSWPMTELVKASLVQAKSSASEQAKVHMEENAALGISQLFTYYLEPAKVKGAYVDQLGEHDQVVSDVAAASTFYHLVVAYVEAQNYIDQHK